MMREKTLLTSNINLLETNNVWSHNLIKKGVFFDGFSKILLSLNDKKVLSKYDSFISIIYLNDYFEDNFKKIFIQLEKAFLKNKNKKIVIFLFLEKTNNFIIDNKNLQNTNNFVNKIIKLSSKNFKIILKFDEKKKIYNTRNKFLLKCPFSSEGLSLISIEILKILNEKEYKPFKLIILDCDNTLWGGNVGEDGVENLKYSEDGEGKIYEKVQKHFKFLKKLGFMLTICSKNNSKDVWKAFGTRKMNLKKNDFLFPKINWEEKSLNIEKILNEFSLRSEDVLFVDDSKLEIQKVRKKFKKISTFHVNDISHYYDGILSLERLQKYNLLEEDQKKHNQYKLKKKYHDLKSVKTDYDEIFYELAQKVKFLDINNNNISRAEQLFNKTNQFNFTSNRYNKIGLLKIVKNKNSSIKLVSLRDKFGDHGIIGSFSYQKKKKDIFIQDFILSCRILSRKIEEYIIYYIKNKFKKHNVYVMYVRNNQNKDLINIFLKKDYLKLITRKASKPNHFLYKILFKKDLRDVKKFF